MNLYHDYKKYCVLFNLRLHTCVLSVYILGFLNYFVNKNTSLLEKVLFLIEEYICKMNMAHMVKSGKLRQICPNKDNYD